MADTIRIIVETDNELKQTDLSTIEDAVKDALENLRRKTAMSSYQVEFFNKLRLNIRELETKLTADENNNLTHSPINTCYWAKTLQQTFSDMGDVGMMLAMGASCDFSLAYERDKILKETHDKELFDAVSQVAKRVTEANQGK